MINTQAAQPSRRTRLTRLVLWFLVIEWMDEVVFGVRQAAWPLIRTELALTYVQVGLLLGVPGVVGTMLELPLGILGDVWQRRRVVVGSGLAYALALALVALSPTFLPMLLAFVLLFPAAGGFVSLAQATLMDLDPARREQNMARWTLAGSAGVVAGPLALGAVLWLGGSWRGLFIALAVGMAVVALAVRRQRFPAPLEAAPSDWRAGIAGAWRALRRPDIWRWLILLMFADFMLDLLLDFLALYGVDVVGLSPVVAGGAVAVWTGVGLVGDFLLIPLLERVRGLSYLRASAAVTLVLYPAFLLVPSWPAKLLLLGALGLANAGWYAILQGQFYAALPGQSGTAMTVAAAFGILSGVVPSLLGLVAEWAGLEVMMWLLVLGPIALLVGLPRHAPEAPIEFD